MSPISVKGARSRAMVDQGQENGEQYDAVHCCDSVGPRLRTARRCPLTCHLGSAQRGSFVCRCVSRSKRACCFTFSQGRLHKLTSTSRARLNTMAAS